MWDVLMVHNIIKSCVLFFFLILGRTLHNLQCLSYINGGYPFANSYSDSKGLQCQGSKRLICDSNSLHVDPQNRLSLLTNAM